VEDNRAISILVQVDVLLGTLTMNSFMIKIKNIKHAYNLMYSKDDAYGKDDQFYQNIL